jgi:hypothetical protein
MPRQIALARSLDSWPIIEDALSQVGAKMTESDLISVFTDTLQTIYESVGKGSAKKHFGDLPRIFDQIDPVSRNQFLHTTLPAMAQDILVFVGNCAEVGYLPSDYNGEVELSVSDVYVLVSMSFLGIPLVHASGETTLRDGTCVYMFSNRPKQVAKLTCLLNYFNVMVAARQSLLPPEVCDRIVNRRIVLQRLVLTKSHGAEWWLNECKNPMSAVRYMEKFVCIESAHDAVQADFANKHIGGGVLRTGCVQEEIRFIISPECLISVFLCDPLVDNEALLIRNTLQISSYSGYSQSFKCTGFSKVIKTLFSGNSNDSRLPIDDIICIDATPFTAPEERNRQFTVHSILRELEKCRCGLSFPGNKPFATGNWGCGVFGGDSQLKAVIQWIAASACSRDLIYFPFDDVSTSQLPELARVATAFPVSEIFRTLLECIRDESSHQNIIRAMIERFSNSSNSNRHS